MGKIKLPNDFLMYPIISNLGGNMHHAYEIWVKFAGYLKEEIFVISSYLKSIKWLSS